MSESEFEEDSNVTVSVAAKKGKTIERTEKNKEESQHTQQRAIRLYEIGPRLQLRLLKIENGLGKGEVLYHHVGNISCICFNCDSISKEER